MIHRPSPPTTAAALSGFVVGVLLTLISTGFVAPSGSSSPHVTPTVAPSTPVADSLLKQRVSKIVSRQLGTDYPTLNGSRLTDLQILPSEPLMPESPRPRVFTSGRSVYIRFRLYDHPLGKAWRLKAAKADVFAVMKALYTSSLPIYNVEMEGTFPLRLGNVVKERRALVVIMDHFTAATIPWNRWGRESEGRLWNLLTYASVDPQFA
jgi:hypothetical protein